MLPSSPVVPRETRLRAPLAAFGLLLAACSSGHSGSASVQPELAIVGVQPADGATGVPATEPIVVSSGEQMQLASLLHGALVVRDGAGLLAGQVAYLPAAQQLVWTPDAELPRGTRIEVVVTTAAQGQSGLSLRRDRSSSFTVVDGQFQPPAMLGEVQVGARPSLCVDRRGNFVGGYGDLGLSWQGGSWQQPVPLGPGKVLGVASDLVGNAALLRLHRDGQQSRLEVVRRPPFAPFGAPELVVQTSAQVGIASIRGNQHGDLAVHWIGSDPTQGAGVDGILVADAETPQLWQSLPLPAAGTFPQRLHAIDGRGDLFTLQRGPARLLLQRQEAVTRRIGNDIVGSELAQPIGLCADDAGNCIAVWIDFVGVDVLVQAQRRLADGTFEPLRQLFRGVGVERVQLIGSDHGHALLAFTTPTAAADALQVTQFDPDGGTWSAPEVIATDALQLPNGADCVLAAARAGEFWIAFERLAAGDLAELAVVRARPRQGLAPARAVFTAMPAHRFGVPAVAVDDSGRAALLFTLQRALPSGPEFVWGVRFE